MRKSEFQAKLARVQAMHAAIQEAEGMFGRDAASPFAWLKSVRLVKPNEPWAARIIRRAYITSASEAAGREQLIEAAGWTVYEVYIRGRRRLAFNANADVVVVHHYEPGLWETWLGEDSMGDIEPILPGFPATGVSAPILRTDRAQESARHTVPS